MKIISEQNLFGLFKEENHLQSQCFELLMFGIEPVHANIAERTIGMAEKAD